MWEVSPELRTLLNIIFLAITGAIAYHGIRYRDEEGNTDIVRLLLAVLALRFFFWSFFRMYWGLSGSAERTDNSQGLCIRDFASSSGILNNC